MEGLGSFPSPQENRNESFQTQKEELKKGMQELGIVENPDMISLREQMANPAPDEKHTELYSSYEGMAMEQIENIKDQRGYMRAQVGLLVANALLYLEVNDPLSAIEELNGAFEYAQNIGDKEAEDSIKEHIRILV